MQSVDFTLSDAMPNRILSVGYNNINNTDVWLYDLNSIGVENNLWKSVPAVAGINVIYNRSEDRNIYQVNTKAGDQIDLVFGDGSFSNIPQGNYRLYMRVSNNQTYKISPSEMQNVSITMSYISRAGKTEYLTVRASLNYTVTNANSNESLDDIRQKAPQQYYTQGRMITGEDYNIVPYTEFTDILKVKAVNRTSSGVSRFLDVNDTTGKYSSTNIFAQDGYLYRKELTSTLDFTFFSSANVQQMTQDDLTQIVESKEMQHFYYANFPRYDLTYLDSNSQTQQGTWNLSTIINNGSTGYFEDTGVMTLGYYATNNAGYIRAGSVIQFSAGTGKYFTAQNLIKSGTPKYAGDKLYIYASVRQIVGDGTNGGVGNLYTGQGPVTLSQKVPTGAVVNKIIPVFKNSLPQSLISTDVIPRILSYTNFGLRYDTVLQEWRIIEEANLDKTGAFSLSNANGANDSSWLVRFQYSNNIGYTIYWRGLSYYFESQLETKFYFDPKVKIYDSSTGTTIVDYIKVLKVNPQANSSTPLGVDYTWNIYKNIIEEDGYENQNKILVTFTDDNVDGVPDNPDLFEIIIAPATDPTNKLVFFQRDLGYDGFYLYTPVNPGVVMTEYATKIDITAGLINQPEPDGQIFYATTDMKFYVLTGGTLVESSDYSEATKTVFYWLSKNEN